MATGASLSDSHRWHTKTAAQVTRKDVNQVDPSAVPDPFSLPEKWVSGDWLMGSLRRQRERAGLSRAELAHKCGLSESTIRNLETGRHVPCAQTLQAIATVLNPLGPANPPIGPSLAVTPQLGFAPARGPGVWPGSDDMLHLYERLRRALAGEGGYLPLPWLLSDPACATVFSDFRNRHDPLVQRGLWKDVAQVVRQLVGRRTLDVLALACADARDEISLLGWLMSDGLLRMRVLLMEQSSALLGAALRRAVMQLGDVRSIQLAGLQAALTELPQHAMWSGDHPRLFTLLAPQLGLLDGEMLQLRQTLWLARPLDLLLLGFDVAAGPAQDRRYLQQRDPMLADARRAEPQLVRLAETLFRNHVQAPRDLRLSTAIDLASCAIPSSYAVELRAEVQGQSSRPRQFSVWRSKRYQPSALAQSMQQEGFRLLAEWQQHEQTPAMGLQLYQRTVSPVVCAAEARPPWGSGNVLGIGESLPSPQTLAPSLDTFCTGVVLRRGRRRGVTLCRAIEQARCQPVPANRRGLAHSVGDRAAKLARLLLRR